MIAELSPRVERKFALPASAAGAVLAWLEHACLADPRHPAAIVSSVYFDTLELAAWRQNRDGDYLREKLRLRWYALPEASSTREDVTCWLEVKLREGATSRKRRAELVLPRRVVEDAHPDWEAIEAAVAGRPELAEGAAPVLRVRYERRRFVDPASGARLALDGNIRCDAANPARVAAHVPGRLGACVLEVKAAGAEVPRLLGPIRRLVTPTSFSKYARCLRLALEPGGRGSMA